MKDFLAHRMTIRTLKFIPGTELIERVNFVSLQLRAQTRGPNIKTKTKTKTKTNTKARRMKSKTNMFHPSLSSFLFRQYSGDLFQVFLIWSNIKQLKPRLKPSTSDIMFQIFANHSEMDQPTKRVSFY